jgi:flavin-binding protein dodecin
VKRRAVWIDLEAPSTEEGLAGTFKLIGQGVQQVLRDAVQNAVADAAKSRRPGVVRGPEQRGRIKNGAVAVQVMLMAFKIEAD